MAKNKFSGKRGAGPKPKPAPKQHPMTEALKNVEKIMANGGKHVDQAKNGPSQKQKSTGKEGFSLDEVLAMGGTKEDFDMLDGVDSGADDAVVYGAIGDKGQSKLAKELKDLIGELGLAKFSLGDDDEGGDDAALEDGSQSASGVSDDDMSDVSEGEDEADEPLLAEDAVQQPAAKNKPAPEKKKESEKAGKGRSEPGERLGDASVKLGATLPAFLRQRCSQELKPKPALLIPPAGQWHAISLAVLAHAGAIPEYDSSDVEVLKEYAARLLKADGAKYAQQQAKSNPGDVKWMETVFKSGTLSDKVAAATVMLQEAPVHMQGSLKFLVEMACSKGKREAVMAADALLDLFRGALLPANRKLRFFHQQALTHPQVSDKHLALWLFEDDLKRKYMAFVGGLETLSHDVVLPVKSKAVKAIYELLVAKPEQERNLLAFLVNKMGDNERKLASKVVYLLTSLADTHPYMKTPIVAELQQLIFRPNIKDRARYYAVCYLNQIVLSQRDKGLANTLIDVYFTLFHWLTKSGEVQTKMLSAILTGINRAFPFADVNDEVYDQHLDTLFKVVHVGTFATAVQALMLLFQVMFSRQSVTDRFYRALYSKIQEAYTQAQIKQAAFLNVLYKALSVDPSANRIRAFVKRLLQLAMGQNPPFACATLYLVSELSKVKPVIFSMVTQPEGDDEERFVDASDSDAEPANGDSNGGDGDGRADKSKGGADKSWVAAFAPYDPMKREPLYAGAEHTCAWELTMLASHYHPSVARFASTLLCAQHIEYASDPLQDFTLMRFLDKFVFRNPKRAPTLRGASHMQRHVSVIDTTPVNSEEFLKRAKEDIAPEDLFFFQYFTDQKKNKPKAKKVRRGEDEDEDFDLLGEEKELDEDEFARAMLDEEGGSSDEEVAEEDMESDEGGYDYADLEGASDAEEDDDLDNVDWNAVAMASSDESEADDADDAAAGEKRPLADDSEEEWASLDEESNGGQSKGAAKGSANKKKQKRDNLPTFASADDFAHLLEDSGENTKQAQWEERNAGFGRKTKSHPGKGRGFAKGKGMGGNRGRGRGRGGKGSRRR